MAWETLTWWLRNRRSLAQLDSDDGDAPSLDGMLSPRAPHEPPGPEMAGRDVAACVAALVDQLADSLERGAGGSLRTTAGGRQLLRASPAARGQAMVHLARAIADWPHGPTVPSPMTQGPRLLANLLDEIASGAEADEPQLVEVLDRLAGVRPSVGPLDGLVHAAESLVDRGRASARLQRPLRDLRHGLPLEARGLRHRVQQLLRRLGRGDG